MDKNLQVEANDGLRRDLLDEARVESVVGELVQALGVQNGRLDENAVNRASKDLSDSIKKGLDALRIDFDSFRVDSMFFQFTRRGDDEAGLENRVAEYVRRVRAMLVGDMVAFEQFKSDERSLLESSGTSNQVERLGSFPFSRPLFDLIVGIMKSCETVTAVMEEAHVDPSYRDTYYNHYSGQFFDIPRRSLRISFFEGSYPEWEFRREPEDELDKCFIGCCVIDPQKQGVLGRTLIKPEYLVQRTSRLRLSRFDVTVRGKRLHVSAFPFRTQDGEALRCAEISLLNMMCYYSNEFNDYGVVLPSDIVEYKREYSHERVMPSRGLDYYTLTKILAQFGFFPRLYNVKEVIPAIWSGLSRDDCFRRLLHWYVCSGIPVGVNICPQNVLAEGHSVLCVGHESMPEDDLFACARHFQIAANGDEESVAAEIDAICDAAEDKSCLIYDDERDKSCVLMQSADFYDTYIVNDDCQLPYAAGTYKCPSARFPELLAENYSVPLHKGMALDAMDAHDCFVALLSNETTGLLNWAGDLLDDQERLVMRMFIASSRSYKRFRVKESGDELRAVYEQVPLPHFVWAAEVFRVADYFKPLKERKAFAEIVLDATSGGGLDDPLQKVVLMRYPKQIVARPPDDSRFLQDCLKARDAMLGDWPPELDQITPYSRNLEEVIPHSAVYSGSTESEK